MQRHFLKSAQPLAQDEKATLKWYAIKLGPGKFGIFDTFANEAGRNTHLTGEIAKALTARANEFFAVRKRLTLKGDYKWQTQRKQQLLQVPREESERVSSKRS